MMEEQEEEEEQQEKDDEEEANAEDSSRFRFYIAQFEWVGSASSTKVDWMMEFLSFDRSIAAKRPHPHTDVMMRTLMRVLILMMMLMMIESVHIDDIELRDRAIRIWLRILRSVA